MKTRSNMLLFVVACSNVKQLTDEQINMLRCGDYLVKRDASGEHAYKVTFKSATGMCITYHDAYCVETQSYDKVDGKWVYNSEDKTIIAEPSLENIVDKDGNKRFIEGDVEMHANLVDVNISYAKWSLSGTHLMIVIAGSCELDAVFTPYNPLATITLPKWIHDKIYPVFDKYIEQIEVTMYADDWSSQTFYCLLGKTSNNKLEIRKTGSNTLTANRSFRIVFDLLIDNE